jgi:Uma2 family endonuclease
MSQIATHQPRRHRLSVADYYRLAEAGILRPDEPVELIDGDIIDMAPIDSRHNATVDRLAAALQIASAGGRAIVRAQGSIALGAYSEPEPDIALLRPRADFYWSEQPGPADILLLVEVAASSLPYDRDVKVPLYARHQVAEVWLIDIEARRLTRYRNPSPRGYSSIDDPDLRAPLPVEMLVDVRVDLSALFPSP